MQRSSTSQLRDSYPVSSYRKVTEWYCQPGHIKIASNLREQMQSRFGQHNTTVRGEFFHRVWVLQYQAHTFQVFCSKQGTSVELVGELYTEKGNPIDRSSVCVAFLEELQKALFS